MKRIKGILFPGGDPLVGYDIVLIDLEAVEPMGEAEAKRIRDQEAS